MTGFASWHVRDRYLMVLAAFTLACGHDRLAGPTGFGPVSTNAITDQLADSLETGFFPTATLLEEPVGILTADQARRLANAYFRTFSDGLRTSWSVQRGAAIPASTFGPCGRTLAAEGAYTFDSPPPTSLSTAVSGRYLIHGCNAGGDVIALLSVSAQGAADTTLDGYITTGSVAANTFFSVGVPTALTNGMVLSPERAAELAFAASGLRVSAVPRLFSSLHPDAPHFARWEIRLEDTLVATGVHTATTISTIEVLIGFDESVFAVSSPRLLRAVSRAIATDPPDSLPAHDFVGDTTYFIPAQVRTKRARSVEPIVRIP